MFSSVSKKMSPFLEKAILHARMLLPLKSANKFYPDKALVNRKIHTDPKRWGNHTEQADIARKTAVYNLRQHRLTNDALEKKLIADRDSGIKHGGNCGENATLAFMYLTAHKIEIEKKIGREIVIMKIFMPQPVDHCYVVVGTRSKKGNKFMEHTMVCDPWAKITCKLSNYPNEWKAKMRKWENRGLRCLCSEGVYGPYSDRDSRESMDNGKFEIVTYSGLDEGQKNKFSSNTLFSLRDKRILG